MADERQMVIFEADEQAKITKMVQELQPDGTLTAFKDLSNIIEKAISMLPTKVVPILQQLCASYSITRTAIEVGFTDSSGILSEFVIKSWQVMQNGMNKNDGTALTTLGNQLNIVFINKLDEFVESSRAELVDIQSQLLLEATGGKVQSLLDKRKELEIDYLQLSALLTNKASECGVNQGIIDLLQLAAILTKIGSAFTKNQLVMDTLQAAKNFSPDFNVDLAAAKNDMKSGAAKLKGQIRDCKNKVQEHRDYLSEKGKSLSLLSRKLKDVNVGNIVTSAHRKLNQLIERTDSPDGINEASECSTSQKIIDSFQHGKEIFDKVAGDLDAAKDEMKGIIARLKGQIHDYKNKLQQHHDTHLEQKGSFWIFSWKVRDVYAGHGEKIMQENINRLIERTNFLDGIFQNGSIADLIKGLLHGKAALPFYEEKQIQLEQEHQELKERHDQVSKEFHAVIEEIDGICRLTGTINVESMKMVDELCCAVQSGQESIVSAYAIMRIHLSAINVDPDLLVSSVLDALQVLHMVDGYSDTTKIEDIKKVLALQ